MLKLSLEDIKIRIFKLHGDVVKIDDATFKDTQTKCKFIDKNYGEWWALPSNILRGRGHIKRRYDKQKLTNINRYGMEYLFQSEEIKEKLKEMKIL